MAPSPPPPTIILIGLRGSGKSTVGSRLASALGATFVDLDDRTPAEMGCATVAEAFAKGEPDFRNAEMRALRACLTHPPRVLALGGGAPTAPGARELLTAEKNAGRVKIVYLRASVAALRSRLACSDNAHRPPLLGGWAGSILDEVGEIWRRRDPLFQDLADWVIDVDELDPAGVCSAIVAHLNQ